MNTFAEKLRKFRLEKGLTQKKLADLINVTPVAVSRWEKGLNYPQRDTTLSLCRALGIKASTLIDEHNENIDNFSATPNEQKVITKYRACDERGRGMVETVLDYEYQRTLDLLSKNDNDISEPFVTVPVPHEPMAAGFGNYLSDSSYEEISFAVSKVPNGTDYGVRISGDSMNPTIPNGCVAFIRSRPAIENGKIGIFSLNGEGYCKRLSVDSERRSITLVSDNDKYEPISVTLEDYLHTYGEVLGWSEV